MSRFSELKKSRRKIEEEQNVSSSTSKTNSNNESHFSKMKKNKLLSTINLNTLQSDLTNLTTSIDNVYKGWQTRETMDNTLSSVKSMYDRIGKYQEYSGANLSEIQGILKSTMDGWEDLSRQYARYKSADEYTKGLQKVKDSLAEEEKMKTDNLGVVRKELSDLETVYNNAKKYNKEIGKGSFNVRSKTDAEKYLENQKKAIEERDAYSKSVGFDSYDELEKAYGEKKRYLNRAEWLQKGIELSSNLGDDFNEKSQYVEPKQKTGFVFGNEYDDEVYKFINDEDYRLDYSSKVNDSGSAGMLTVGYEYMTDMERKTYNYYYNSGDMEKAQEYLNTITESLGNRKAIADYERFKGNTFSELLYGVNAGFDQFATGMKNVLSTEDEYIPVNATQQLSGMIRDDLSYNHGGWGTVPYDFITTTSNMLPSILTSYALGTINPTLGANVGAGLLGASAAGNAYQEMLNLGYDRSQAWVYSAITGVSEAYLQKALGGIGALGGTGGKIAKWVKNIDNAAAKFAIQYGGAIGSEALEEGLQEVLNPFFKKFVAGYDTGDNVDWGEVFYSALLGGLSGGFMEGGPLAINSIRENNANKQMGADIRSKERIKDLIDLVGDESIGEAYDTYSHFVKKGVNAEDIKDAQVGRLYNEAYGSAVETLNNKKSTTEQREKSLETLNKLGMLSQENVARKEAKANAEKYNVDEASNVDVKNVEFKDGKISDENITLKQRDADLVGYAEQIAKEKGDDMANLFLSQYDGKTDVDKYATDFNLASEYADKEFSFDHIIKNKGSLSATMVSDIYKGTIIKAAQEKKAKFEKLVKEMADKGYYKGFVEDSVIDYNNTSAEGKINWNDLTSKQKESVKFMKGFAQATGMRIELVANHPKFNGNYNPDTNVITINLDNMESAVEGIKDSVIPALSHETTHWMKNKSPELWTRMNEIVFTTLVDHYNSNTDLEGKRELLRKLGEYYNDENLKARTITEADLIQKEIKRLQKDEYKGKNKTDEELESIAREEIIAKACEDLLSMSKQGKKMFATMTAEEQKTFVGKIKTLINELMAWLDKTLGLYKADSTEALIMRQYKDQLQKASQVWDEMLKRSVKVNQALEKSGAFNNKNTDNSNVVKMAKELQLKEPTKLTEEDFESLLSFAEQKLFEDGSYIPARIGTPQILIDFAKTQGYELENYPLAMNVYKVRQALANEMTWDGNPMDTPHDLSPSEVIEIVKAMSNPSYLVYQTRNDRFAEIVKFEKDGGKRKAYAIIDFFDVDKNPNVMNGYKGGKYNILVTIYPSEDSNELKSYLKNKNNIVITGEEMKKKGISQRGLGSYVPAHLNDIPFYMDSILDSAEDVKTNISTNEEFDSIGSRDLSELTGAKDTNGNELFQYKAMVEDENTYRDMLDKYKDVIGITDQQIDALFTMVDNAVDIISENLEALDYAWDEDINDRAFHPVKANSDKLYKVSLDFSTLCRKRLLQQTIQATLQEALNKQLSTEEAIAIRDELIKIQEEGRQIEVACALCYVESARMKSPEQIKKFIENRENVIREFFANRSQGDIKEKIKNAELRARKKLAKDYPDGMPGKNGVVLNPLEAKLNQMSKSDADYIRDAKKKAKAKYELTEHEQAELNAALSMDITDFTSAKGLENLAKKHSDIFDAYTSYIRNATHSKGLENDVWWRAGDSDAISDTLIEQMNAENGLRSQSWSDFQVIHLLDYIAATIELSTRKAKRQSYTKVPDYVKLLGNTGDMINMSVIPERVFSGKLGYDDVEGMAYKIACELRETYHETAGIICIGIDNDQIRLLLEDLTIDMVIPYHKSSMAKERIKLMHIPDWKDFEAYQNETTKLTDAEAKARAKEYGVKLLKATNENYQKSPKFSEWFNLEEARKFAEYENYKAKNGNPSDVKAYKKYGIMYGGYMAMQNAANKYLKLCAERGLLPKFAHEKADFSKEANYWKLLIDRKMVDNVTGEIIEQKAIKPIFNEKDVLGILNDELARYPQVKADQDYATRKVTEKFLSGEMKVDASTLEAIKKTVDNVTEVNILESSKGMANEMLSAKDMDAESFFEELKNAELYMLDGRKYFEKAIELYSKYQDGKANQDNYYYETIANFTTRKSRPSRKPDFVSRTRDGDISSEYWYTEDGVIRGSKHWGEGVASCDWFLDGNFGRKASYNGNKEYGFCKWEDFIYKTWIHKTPSRKILRTFKNSTGKGDYVEDGRIYSALPSSNGKIYIDLKTGNELYSSKDSSVYEHDNGRDSEIEKLKADVENLRERLALEKKITGGNEFNRNQLGAVAGHLRKIANSNMDKLELMKALKGLYTHIATSQELAWDDVWDMSYKIAKKMIDESTPITIADDYAKKILKHLQGSAFSLDETQKAEAQYIFDKHRNRSFMGKVKVRNDAPNIDTMWQEWSGLFPDVFDADIGNNKIRELYDIIESLKDASETIDEYSMEEKTKWLAHEIYNQYWNVSNIKTTADKYNEKIKALESKHRKMMRETREAYEESIESQKLVDDMYYKRKLAEQKGKFDSKLAEQRKNALARQKEIYKNLRERRDIDVAIAKEKGKANLDKYKERAERKTLIQKITANALTLNKWLTTNSKDYHIHEAMKNPVIKLLQAIDFSSKSKLEKGVITEKDISFAEAFAEVKTMLQNATDMVVGFEEFYGHDLAESIDMMTKATYNLIGDNTYVINAMSNEELYHLNKLIQEIKRVVTNLNKFHILQHNKGAVNLEEEFRGYGEKLGTLEKQHGTLAKFFNFRNRTPYYFFKDLGEVGKKIFKAFQDGWDKFAFNIKTVIDYANKTYTEKEVKQWGKETKEFTLKQRDGSEKTINMSVAQIMALHCIAKQEDAKYHLLNGGITLKRFDKNGNVITDYDNTTLSVSDLQKILSTLTDRQIEVADALQKFMNTVCTKWGNEISMARFGVEMFGIPDYFPIKVSEANVPSDNTKDVDNASLFRLLNMSFTKARTKDAPQSIEIGDIFDIFAQHSSDMAKYNALALPVLDFNKFYSITGQDSNGNEYGTVKTLKNVFGDEANGYIRRFVRDLNGSQNVSRDVLGNTFFKNSKVASVAANLRVVLLQPTAFHKASAILDNKYLAKASAYLKGNPITMPKRFKKAIADAEKHCGIVQWKSLGYYDTDVSKGVTEKIKHANTWIDKAVDLSLKGAELFDKLTFGTLWVACEYEIRETRKDLEVGKPEFFKAIAERLREVIYATQVVDSTMTRSDMMRSPDKHDKMYTTFGSEPTIAYNMLLDTVTEYQRDKKVLGKEQAKKKNGKKIRKVVTAYVVTNLMAALVESAFDIFRDDDDEEKDITTFLKLFFKNFLMDMSIGNKLPYIKEAYSILQGYSSSRMDTQWMVNAYYTATNVIKHFEGDGNWEKTIKYLIKSSSDLSGLPFYNVYRDAMALLDKLDIFED